MVKCIWLWCSPRFESVCQPELGKLCQPAQDGYLFKSGKNNCREKIRLGSALHTAVPKIL